VTKRTLVDIFWDARKIEPRLGQHNVLPGEFVAWMMAYASLEEKVAKAAWKEEEVFSDLPALEEQVALPFANAAALRKLALEAVVEHGCFPVTGKGDEAIPAGGREVIAKYLIEHSDRSEDTLLFLGLCERRIDLSDHLNRVSKVLYALKQRQFILEPVMREERNDAPVILRVTAQLAEDAEPQPAPLIPLREFLREGLAGTARVMSAANYPNIVWIIWPDQFQGREDSHVA
jgi:hypothetical protein